jgi:hypothetical protein
VEFVCYGARDEEGTGDVDVEDLAKCADGVGARVAFAGDGCTGYETADRMTEFSSDGVEG